MLVVDAVLRVLQVYTAVAVLAAPAVEEEEAVAAVVRTGGALHIIAVGAGDTVVTKLRTERVRTLHAVPRTVDALTVQ